MPEVGRGLRELHPDLDSSVVREPQEDHFAGLLLVRSLILQQQLLPGCHLRRQGNQRAVGIDYQR